MSPSAWRKTLEVAVGGEYRVRVNYYRGDGEALKYSFIARRWLGPFSVLATIDRRSSL
jgi:hypothetical protein